MATDGELIYLAYDAQVVVYRRADVMAAANAHTANKQRASVAAIQRIDIKTSSNDRFEASYLTVHAGYLYVGNFTSDWLRNLGPGIDYPTSGAELRRYSLATGKHAHSQSTGLTKAVFNKQQYQRIAAPRFAQGAAITKTGLLFSTSYGSGKFAPKAALYFQPATNTAETFTASGKARVATSLPHYAEGIAIISGRPWVLFESAAHKYRHKVTPIDHIQVYNADHFSLSAAEMGLGK